eukprot:5223449-Pyramimonas_sp.AAC.1
MSIVSPIPIPSGAAWAPLADSPPLDGDLGRSLRVSRGVSRTGGVLGGGLEGHGDGDGGRL